MDLANPGIMAEFANLPTVNSSVQSALLGQQNIQQNQNVLQQQQRAEEARKATAIATDPNAVPEARQAAMGTLQQNDPAAAYALRQQVQRQQDISAYVQNPTTKGALSLYLAHPDLKDSLDKGVSMLQGDAKQAKLSAVTDILGYLKNGDANGAAKIAQAHIDADRAAGLPVDGAQNLLNAINSDPKTATALGNMMLVGLAGPDKIAESVGKVGENTRADELQPSVVRKAGAEATTAEVGAQFAPQKAQSELDSEAAQRERMATQNATDRINAAVAQGRLALDQTTLATNTQLKMAELDQSGGKLPEGSLKLVNDSAGAAAEAQMLADREDALAQRIDAAGMHGSVAASGAELWKSITGSQDGYTQIRAEWNQLRNAQALTGRKNMPGAMSDADRNFLMQGFPAANAKPEYIAKFLRTMAKAQRLTGAIEDTKAAWVSQNGNLGPTNRDIVINGMRIPRGMTLTQYQAAAAKLQPQELPADAAAVVQRARQ